ncbi:MAG TPA: PhzF family phenazine biosynthesis protein [Solirubrobacterales bacterium]|nr:PhzF family phenazine biosynthesis protein [Solirubrobacterales bacterium]
MPTLNVLRVFVNEDSEWGNPLGAFLDGELVPDSARQGVAAELGFSETVFVDDRASGQLRIYTPTVELPFAGHPTVGAAWLLDREGSSPKTVRLPAGEVEVRQEDHVTFIAAQAEWAPPFEYRQLDSPADVRAVAASEQVENAYLWSWIDAAAGTIRARSFVPEVGIAEDEATGSAAIGLCARLGRPITVHQGHGSVLLCRPLRDGRIEVGGTVVLDATREHPIDGVG